MHLIISLSAPSIIDGDFKMNIKFMRKLCNRSEGNKAALLSIPRPISQAWSDANYDALEMLFDGDKLVIVPMRS